MRVFTPEGVEPDEKAIEQILHCLEDERAVDGALMADHHLGYSMPIGGVIRYDGAISPSGVGYDIACGNKAVLTDLTVSDIAAELPAIMQEVQRRIAFGMGRANDEPVDHPLFDEYADVFRMLDLMSGKRDALLQKARAQLGTVGSGNHYVDLLADERNRVWIANHFGSRGLGHTIATGFLNFAACKPFYAKSNDSGLSAPKRAQVDDARRRMGLAPISAEEPTVIPTDSDLGQAYISAMTLAGDYAYAGRDYVAWQVLKILGASSLLSVHNHHNFAWLEDGLWVVRKGATPLTRDLAYIGGSMGDGAVIVHGKASYARVVRDIGALDSAPHGSGRVMSRTKAAGKFVKVVDADGRKRRVRDASTGIVDWPTVRAGLAERGVVVLGSGADEAPEVYKPLDPVIAAHPNIEVVYRLRPLGVVMAGDDVFDPYKD